jgi:hypothetical protein
VGLSTVPIGCRSIHADSPTPGPLPCLGSSPRIPYRWNSWNRIGARNVGRARAPCTRARPLTLPHRRCEPLKASGQPQPVGSNLRLNLGNVTETAGADPLDLKVANPTIRPNDAPTSRPTFTLNEGPAVPDRNLGKVTRPTSGGRRTTTTRATTRHRVTHTNLQGKEHERPEPNQRAGRSPPAHCRRTYPTFATSAARRANMNSAPRRSLAGTSANFMTPRSTRIAQPVARPSWPGNQVDLVGAPQPQAHGRDGRTRRTDGSDGREGREATEHHQTRHGGRQRGGTATPRGDPAGGTGGPRGPPGTINVRTVNVRTVTGNLNLTTMCVRLREIRSEC